MQKRYFIFGDEHLIHYIKYHKGVGGVIANTPYTKCSLGVHVPGDSPVPMMELTREFNGHYKEITLEEFENVKQQLDNISHEG